MSCKLMILIDTSSPVVRKGRHGEYFGPAGLARQIVIICYLELKSGDSGRIAVCCYVKHYKLNNLAGDSLVQLDAQHKLSLGG